MDHDQVELLIEKQGREILRELLQSHLDLRSFSEAVEPVVGADGVERTHRREDEGRSLTTVFGDVWVNRTRHEDRAMNSLCPLDGDLNLPREQYSPKIRRQMVKDAVRGTYELTVERLGERVGKTVHSRQLRELIQRAAADFDPFYQQRILAGRGLPPKRRH